MHLSGREETFGEMYRKAGNLMEMYLNQMYMGEYIAKEVAICAGPQSRHES